VEAAAAAAAAAAVAVAAGVGAVDSNPTKTCVFLFE
jgi:hypothetical protein